MSRWVQSWRTPWLDDLMRAISAPGFRMVALPLVGVTTALVFLTGRRKESLSILAATILGPGVTFFVNQAVSRPRPTDDLVRVIQHPGGFSFPSGHVVAYVTFLGTLAVILTWNMRPSIVRSCIRGAILLALIAVGVSRVYLGTHWPGDVIGGYAFGAGMVIVAVGLWRLWVDGEDQMARVRRRATS